MRKTVTYVSRVSGCGTMTTECRINTCA